MSASAKQLLLNILRQLQRVKSHFKRQIRFCKTNHILALQPPELVSHIEDLESQLRGIEGGVYNIQLELEAAIDLGRGIAERKLHLVYGGSNRGLSKLVLEASFFRRSQVLSIIPRALKPLDSLSDSPTGEELVVSGMQERIIEMLNHADAFIFLPGDLTTLEALITLAS
ncbi:hypothetical protein WN943_010814 [Citrus x changshan-huyou]